MAAETLTQDQLGDILIEAELLLQSVTHILQIISAGFDGEVEALEGHKFILLMIIGQIRQNIKEDIVVPEHLYRTHIDHCRSHIDSLLTEELEILIQSVENTFTS